MEATAQTSPSVTLLDLLSNPLVLDATLRYLPLPTIFRLSSVSKSYQSLIYETPRLFRYLDLSRCRGASYLSSSVLPSHSGDHNWQAERMDESLTEDEFYSIPLRGILTRLSKKAVIKDVHTLVLDGLTSVTHNLLSDVLLSDQYDVRLLSIIGCPNLNIAKFQGLLRYLCRPSRPEGAPRLKGVYVFGTNPNLATQDPSHPLTTCNTGITTIQGAQIGALPSTISNSPPTSNPQTSNSNPWFLPTGAFFPYSSPSTDTWEETIRVCSGLIAFDAVLCTHMHDEMAPFRSQAMNAYLNGRATVPPLAVYALGPKGCAGCGGAPKGAPIWGEDDVTAFPLVHPPPFSGRLVDAVRPPPRGKGDPLQRLVVSCTWCLSDRHCQSCHRYWCGRCYDPQQRTRALQLEAQAEHDDEHAGAAAAAAAAGLEAELRRPSAGGNGTFIKVYNGLCTQFCAFVEDLAAGNGAMWG